MCPEFAGIDVDQWLGPCNMWSSCQTFANGSQGLPSSAICHIISKVMQVLELYLGFKVYFLGFVGFYVQVLFYFLGFVGFMFRFYFYFLGFVGFRFYF